MRKVELKYIASLVRTVQEGKTAANGSRAQIESSNAFASLFAFTYQQQFSLAYSYLWNKGYVQDVLFDVYFTVLRSMKRLSTPKQFNQWINQLNRESCEILVDEKNIHPPRGRIHIPEFPVEDAKRLLEYVFYEEGQEENTIPLETLIEYNHYREHRYGLFRFLTLGVIFALAVFPVSMYKPSFNLSENKEYLAEGRIRYDIAFDTPLPVDTVTAKIGKKQTPVYQSGKHTYYILPTTNGPLAVTATYVNRQSSVQTATVSGVDRKVPTLTDNQVREGEISFFVKDDLSGIDYDRVIATDEKKNAVSPLSYASDTGEIVFPYTGRPLDVYIPDRAGNILHLVVDQ